MHLSDFCTVAKHFSLFLLFILVVGSLPAAAQFEQRRRTRERIERSVRASEERDRARQGEGEAAIPKPKAARLNVDVQSILSAKEHATFAQAKAAAVTRVADGDPAWLYLKFNGKLGDFVLTTRDIEDPTKLRYALFAEVGPKGDVTALSQYRIEFAKEDLAASEFKISLAPAVSGRNRSMPVFLRTASAAKPGQWSSEIRISNVPGFPRGTTDHLTTYPVTLDLRSGNTKYKQMAADYDSILLRGSTDVSIMPRPGTFFDTAVKDAVAKKAAEEGINAANIYFTGDDWMENPVSSLSVAHSRRVFAVLTYKKGDACYYALGEAVQSYDPMASKFNVPAVSITRDIPTQCAK